MKKTIKKIVQERNTELIAKRRAIDEALAYWESNGGYFIKLEVSWVRSHYPNTERVYDDLVARREIISQYLGIECVYYWKSKGGMLILHKKEYLELWELLKKNQKLEKKNVKNFIRGIFKRGKK